MNVRGVAGMAGPLVLVVVPKCPLCLLPLLAAAGVAVPAGPLLNGIVVLIAVAWSAFLLRVAASHTVRVLAVLAGALVIGGRLLSIDAASWIGVAVMLGIAVLRLIARERICARACPSRKGHHGHST
jgi:hypothetical protein